MNKWVWRSAALVAAVVVLMAGASVTGYPEDVKQDSGGSASETPPGTSSGEGGNVFESEDGTSGTASGDAIADEKQQTADFQSAKDHGTETKIAASENTVPEMSDAQKKAKSLLEDMTLEEKIGQMFLIRFPEQDAAGIVRQHRPGGFLLFARDFEGRTPEELRELLDSCQKEAAAVPLLLGVDEEGGTVTRVSRYQQYREQPFASPQQVFRQGGMEQVTEDTRIKSEFLLDLGLNVNLAPVCDISTAPSDFMYRRAFGQDAKATADYVSAVVEAANRAGIGSTLKHFPGYGNNVDTHTGSARDTREYDTFLTEDFLPFQAGIEAGAGSILVCHNIVECMDGQNPASLSPEVHRILREALSFDGVIITDDLVMEAVTDFAGAEDAAVLAVEAGNDLLISSDYNTQRKAVLRAVLEQRLTEERIDESVLRILFWKVKLGLIQ